MSFRPPVPRTLSLSDPYPSVLSGRTEGTIEAGGTRVRNLGVRDRVSSVGPLRTHSSTTPVMFTVHPVIDLPQPRPSSPGHPCNHCLVPVRLGPGESRVVQCRCVRTQDSSHRRSHHIARVPRGIRVRPPRVQYPAGEVKVHSSDIGCFVAVREDVDGTCPKRGSRGAGGGHVGLVGGAQPRGVSGGKDYVVSSHPSLRVDRSFPVPTSRPSPGGPSRPTTGVVGGSSVMSGVPGPRHQ